MQTVISFHTWWKYHTWWLATWTTTEYLFRASLPSPSLRWNQKGVRVEVPTPPHFHWRGRWPCIFSFKRCLCEWKEEKKRAELHARAADCAYWAAGLMWSAAPPIRAINSSPITPEWLFNFLWQEPWPLDSQRRFFWRANTERQAGGFWTVAHLERVIHLSQPPDGVLQDGRKKWDTMHANQERSLEECRSVSPESLKVLPVSLKDPWTRMTHKKHFN